ncbi:MAG: hypothetical protein B7L53_08400 [Thermofilum sp. NZ13]|nr:MAG: hypothetical protein B7L53_08400 [Thermofilum sp. NZ13]
MKVGGNLMPEELSISIENMSQTTLEVRVSGEGHTLLNMLVDELNRNPHVTASYRVDHPLLGVAYLLIRTDGTLTPLDALRVAVDSLRKKLEAMREQIRAQTS